jgi:hypothetical protein
VHGNGTEPTKTPSSNRRAWTVGQRVSRKNSADTGTVVHQDGEIKVRWDSGKTSYYRHGQAANVELTAAEE